MHKHDKKRHRGGSKRLKNANVTLPESVIVSIRDLLAGLDDEDFAFQYLVSEYRSKYCDESVTPANERRSAAIEKWFSNEAKNAITNERIRDMDPGYNVLPRVPLSSFLKFARKLTASVLGRLDDSIVLGTFSGGASTSRPRTDSHPTSKYAGMADVTEGASPYVGVIHRECELFRRYNIFYSLREVEGAVLFTVPKKSDIDRCACKEPDVNMYLQKGVGNHIRRRLRKYGIQLNDQSINRQLAHKASMDGSLATLDLSSASDTICVELVRALLPSDWFLYLNDIRSQKVLVDDTLVTTEMFSSMGNGFTFELESLLFFVLMKTTAYFTGTRGVISVYGDDIIISSEMYDDAVWVLNLFGFSANAAKSFSTGSFRESCGGHYYAGEDVTPFYLKRSPTHLTDLIRILNQLRRWLSADASREFVFPNLVTRWRELARHVPLDLWGGYDYAVDTQLVAPFPSRNVLVRVTEKRIVNELGRYMAWHNQNWNRTSGPEKPGFPAADTSLTCRRRRAKLGAPVHRDAFLREYPNTPDPLY